MYVKSMTPRQLAVLGVLCMTAACTTKEWCVKLGLAPTIEHDLRIVGTAIQQLKKTGLVVAGARNTYSLSSQGYPLLAMFRDSDNGEHVAAVWGWMNEPAKEKK